MDRGTSFSLGYLGSLPLSQMATGVGMLQKPLRELYIKHRKPAKGTLLPECRLSVTSNGLRMTYREAPETPHVPPREDFYPVENLIMWHTVRFIAVKSVEKKKTQVKFAFEPLDNDHSRNKDNLFTTLDKKFHYLLDQQHPPIFTCILRRKSGVKALDVHTFFCDSDAEALAVVTALNAMQNSFQSNQAQETGVFGYSPFGHGGVGKVLSAGSQRQQSLAINSREAASPSARQSVVGGLPVTTGADVTAGTPAQHQHNQIPRHNQRLGNSRSSSTASQNEITTTPPQTIDLGLQLRQLNKTQSKYQGNKGNVVISPNPSPFSSGDRASLSGSQRIYHLSQEDLLSPKISVASHNILDYESFPEGEEDIPVDDGYQYLPHVTHSLEKGSRQAEQNVPNHEVIPPHFASANRKDDLALRVTNVDDEYLTDEVESDNIGPRYVSNSKSQRKTSGYSENKPFNYLGGSESSPKKLNTSGSNSKEGSLTKMGQGYSLSGSSERPQSLQISHTSPVGGHENASGYEEAGGASVDQNRQIFKELLHLQKQQQQYQGRPSKSSNEGSLEGQQRPLLRPPKSPGYLDKPPNMSRTEEAESSPDNSNVVGSRTSGIVAAAQSQIMEPFRTRGSASDSRNLQQQVKTKPIARVPPHKVTGIRVMPENFDSSSVTKRNPSETDALSSTRTDRPQSGMFLQSPTQNDNNASGNFFNDPPKRSHSQHNITSEAKSGDAKQGSVPNWHFGPTKNSSRESSLKSKQQKDQDGNLDNKLGEKLLLSKKKDAEIASVMQNLRLDYRDAPTLTPGAPGGMNFEKSLGYFP